MAKFGRAWFAPKAYGYGATPNTWQGWLATLAFVALIVVEVSVPARPSVKVVSAIATTAGFVVLCWAKTEGGMRWRWGDDG